MFESMRSPTESLEVSSPESAVDIMVMFVERDDDECMLVV